MMFLCLFTVLSMSMAVSSTSSVQCAACQHSCRCAQAAAESGLQFLLHRCTRVTDLPDGVNPGSDSDLLWETLGGHFLDLSGTLNLQGASVTVTETEIRVPPIRLTSCCAEQESTFAITIAREADSPRFTIRSVGRYGDAVRSVEMDFEWALDSRILSYGVVSRNGLIVSTGTVIEADIFSTWENYHPADTVFVPSYVLEAGSRIDGTLGTFESQFEWEDEQLGSQLDGEYDGIEYEQSPAVFDPNQYTAESFDTSVYKDPTTVLKPGVTVGQLTDLSTVPPDDTYEDDEFHAREHFDRPVYRNRTFDNIIIPKGCNPVFENCTFNRITYVDSDETVRRSTSNYEEFNPNLPPSEQTLNNTMPVMTRWGLDGRMYNADSWPDGKTNNIIFQGCTFHGPVITAVPRDYFWTKNTMHFTGVTTFENEYMPESTILAPNFEVIIGGRNVDNSQTTVSGLIVGGVVDVRGEVKIHGTVLSMFEPDAEIRWDQKNDPGKHFRTSIGSYTDPEATTGPPDWDGLVNLRPNPGAGLPLGVRSSLTIRPLYGTYKE